MVCSRKHSRERAPIFRAVVEEATALAALAPAYGILRDRGGARLVAARKPPNVRPDLLAYLWSSLSIPQRPCPSWLQAPTPGSKRSPAVLSLYLQRRLPERSARLIVLVVLCFNFG